jgi:acetoin utilization protein AcuB
LGAENLMDLRSIMTTRVVTVELDDQLEVVKQIFDSMKFRHLLVVDPGHKLCGVISDRDLLRALSPYVGTASENARDTATLRKRVHQIMTRKPITLAPEATVADAISLFLSHRVSCIPIVDKDFKPVGIVSWRDVLKSLAAAPVTPT